ncbi:hypothetical protein B7463_g59, partial [Scytalidium lignicola]
MADSNNAPQVFTYSDGPEYYQQPPPPATKPLIQGPYSETSDLPDIPEKTGDRSVIVLRRTTFWAMVIGLIALFAAAIGGSVGAALGTKAHNNSSKSITSPPPAAPPIT